ncbi:hypothetical protein HNY73_006534 [Argiope bruennichi]|uniref:Uncharacterized protein n=1 Tax=Argiope bruennichi TaxID=94029 RepID=A0A8T0FC66_ARGBR|nr:hypothetical protein HNY73_006534 [Argiope bruennichi]
MEDVQRAIRAHTENPDLKLRFKMRGRTEDISHLILEAPSQAFHRLKNLRRIAINWEMFHLREFHHVKRCSTCQAFIHIATRASAKIIFHFVVSAAGDTTPGSACLMSSFV